MRFLQQARWIHETFKAHPERRLKLTDNQGETEKNVSLKEFFEPRILREEGAYGLGAVKAGIGYIIEADQNPDRKKGGKPKETEKQLELFNQVVEDEVARWKYFTKFDEETKAAHFKHVRQVANELKPEQCKQLAEYHAKLAAEFRKLAQGGEA